MKDLGDIILILALLVLVLLASYYFTRFFAKKSMSLRGGKVNMRVLDRMLLTRDKSILIAEIYGKHYVLAVTNQNISCVDVLTEETVSLFLNRPESSASKGLRTVSGNFFMLLKQRLGIELPRETPAGPETVETIETLAVAEAKDSREESFRQKLLNKLAEEDNGINELESMTQGMNRRRDLMRARQKNKEDESF